MTIKRMLSRALLRTRDFVLGTGSRKQLKIRNSVGTGFAVTAAALAIIVANPIVPAATAGTIRSGSGADACTVDVGNTSNASVTKNGNYCVVTVTSSTTVTFPSYTSSIGVIVVGGGGGGGTDGGAGGSGGEVRYSAAQAVTGGSAASVTIGSGGVGGVWTVNGASNGSATTVSGAGLAYTANGGIGGSGWNNCNIAYGAAGGSGGSGGSSGTGGTGGNGTLNGCPNTGGYSYGGQGGNGPWISGIPGLTDAYYSGGGGGGTCTGSGWNTTVNGAWGGASGGGQGTSFVAGSGATAGGAGTANTGGGGGAGSACTWGGTDKVNQRTAGGAGGSGVAIFSFLANKLTVTQSPDGCVANIAEACLTSAKVQVQDSNGANLSTSGLTVTIVSTSAGTLGGTTSVTTDASGVATFSSFWITGSTVGTSVTLTFESPGYRNTQATFTLRGYAETLNVVSGSTDTTGFFYGTTGVWLATSTNSSISTTTLANELANRDVVLRAASTTTTSGSIVWNSTAVLNEAATATRTLSLRASNSFSLASGGRITSTGQPLNVIVNANMDNSMGGMIHIDGSASAYAIETNGGHVALGGGGTSSTFTWSGLTVPTGPATGYATTGGTSSWWGVELGVNTDIAGQKLIKTGGGNFRAYGWGNGFGTSASVSQVYGVAWESGIIDTGSGSVAMYGGTTGSPNPATGDNMGVGLGINHGTANDTVKAISTSSILLNGSFGTAGTSNAWGVSVSYADLDSGSIATTVNGSSAANIGGSNTFRGPLTVSPSSSVTINGASTYNASVSVTGTSVTTSATMTALDTVALTASAGNVTIGGAITASTANKGVTVKATGDILHNSGAVTTQGGAVLYSADTDATTNGGILLAGSIASNGGAVTLAGNDASGTGYAKSSANVVTTANAGQSGIRISPTGSISSGAGAITMRGQALSAGSSGYNSGVEFEKGSSITSTTGSISVTGNVAAANTATAVWQDGIIVGNVGSGSTATVSSTSGNITFTGDTSLNNTTNRIALGVYTAAISSTSGNIGFNATAGVVDANSNELNFNGTATVNAGSGAITAVGGTLGAKNNINNTTFTSTTGVTLQVPVATFSGSTMAGASPKIIESTGTSFTGAVTTTGLSFSTDTTSVRVGKTTNTAATTFGANASIVGPLEVYGSTATIDASVTVRGSGNDIIVKATGDAVIGNSDTIQTNAGDIIVWANSDKVAGVNNNQGRVAVGTSTTLRSQGGRIWLAGGLDDGGSDATITSAKGAFDTVTAGDGFPDGYGIGSNTSGQSMGVSLGVGYTVSSGGGDIFIAGMNAPASGGGTVATVLMASGLVDAGTGRIGIWGKSQANGDANSGVILHMTDNTAETTIYSANRTAKAVTIYGDSSPSTNIYSDGISAWGWAPLSNRWGYGATHIITSGLKDSADPVNTPGGGQNIVGYGANVAGASGAHGIIWQWADNISKDGPVNLYGQDYDTTGVYNSAGIYIGADNASMYQRFGAWTGWNGYNTNTYTDLAGNIIDMSTSTANITMSASKFVFFEYANAVVSDGYTFKTTGDITLQSTGTTFTSNQNTTHWQFGRITVSGTPRNFTIGKSTDTTEYIWYYAINATGKISFYGRFVRLNNGSRPITTTLGASGTATRNIGILVKATDRVYVNGSPTTYSTSGADVVFWADSDNDGVGSVYSEANMTISTSGGDIVIGGGPDDGGVAFPEMTGRTAGDGIPDGYAAGVNGWGNNYGITLVSNVQLLSGGGNISVAGRGSAVSGDDDVGVALGGAMIYSGSGKIAVYGRSPVSCAANWHRGVMTGYGGRTSFVSNSTDAKAVYIYGNTASCDSAGSVYANAVQGQTSYTDAVAPNGGGVQIYGTQGSASFTAGTWGTDAQESDILELNYWNLVANSGPIKLDAVKATTSTRYGVRFATRASVRSYVGSLSAAVSTGYTAYPTIAAVASTSDVTINADSIAPVTTTFNSTGNLKFQPNANSFDYDSYFNSANWYVEIPNTVASFTWGKPGTNGGNQNSSNLWLTSIASSGDIAIYGGNINLQGGLTTSETSGNGILVKSTGTITTVSGSSGANTQYAVTGTNSTAPLTFWANADAAGEGFIYINQYADLVTKGGPITLAGSTAATDATPTGYAVSNTTSRGGVMLGNTNGPSNTSVRVLSNGGDITIRGKGTAAGGWGIVGYTGFRIDSGTGRILMDGYQTNTGNGLDLESTASNLSSITSAATSSATPAISIVGKCDSTNNTDAGQRALYTVNSGLTISATGGGNISIAGDNAAIHATNPGAIYIPGADILASTGSISIDGGTDGVVTSISTGTSNIGAVAAGSATGDVTLVGDRITSAGTTNVKTTGNVVVESKTASFTSFSLTGTSINAAAASIRLGKTTDTASTMTLGGSLAANGPISVYGGAVTLNAGISVTPSTTGSILIKAGGDIITGASQTFQTQGGNITFWSDSDASGAGRIGLDATTSLLSNGGKITLAGGADNGASTVVSGRTAGDGFPDGWAAGSGSTSNCTGVSGTIMGVFFGTTTTITSAGGDVFIAGKGMNGATGACASGIRSNQDLQITAGAGKIAMYGVASPASTATYSSGVTLSGSSTRKTIISSSNSSADSIVISGDAGSAAVSRASGIFIHGQTAGANVNTIIANTGSGGIQMTGRSNATSTDTIADNVGDGFEIYGTAILAKSGAIVLTGTTSSANNSTRYGFAIDHSTASPGLSPSSVSFGARAATTVNGVDMSTSTSNITVNCDSLFVGYNTQPHTFLTTGTVTIQPADSAQSFDRSIDTFGLTFGSGVSGVTIGQSGTSGTVSGATQNNQDVTVSTSNTIAGPFSVYGKTITVSANQTASTASGILLKATQDVVISAGTNTSTRNTLTSTGGPITLWSNADASGSGAIQLGNYTKLASGGGAVTLGGSATATETAPTGRAINNSTTYPNGVVFGTSASAGNVDILSSNGDISIAGYTNVNTANSMGVLGFAGLTIDSGTGAISITGVADGATGTNNSHGIEMNFAGGTSTVITSAKPNATAITMNGSSINGTGSNTRGLVFWSGTSVNTSTISATGTGGSVSLTGSTSSANTAVSVNLSSAKVNAKAAITIDGGAKQVSFNELAGAGPNTIGGATASTDMSGDITVRADSWVFANATTTFRTSGNFVFEPSSNSFSAAQTLPATLAAWSGIDGFRFGKSTNTADVTINAVLSVAGNVEVYGGAISNAASVSTSAGTVTETGSTFSITQPIATAAKDVTITADQMTIGAAIGTGSTTAGIVTFAPKTVGKNIDLGAADSASLLGLTNTELGFVTAKTLRVGSATAAANINVSANITISAAKAPNLALRGTGNVTTTNSASITAANLGIAVGGTINLPGSNSITGNLALNASGASTSFNQASGSYTPAAVDSIPANFGVVSTISVSQVPTATPQDAFMAVTFNPPPVVTLKDSYGNNLASSNSLASGYTITASLNVISTTSGTMTLSGTTSKATTNGSATFNDLKVTGGTGSATLTFSAAVTGDLTQAAVATAQTTGTYNVQAGDPNSLTIGTSAAGGRSGVAFTTQPVIQIRDVGNNLVQTTPGNSLNVTASLTSGNGTLIGTTTVQAVNAVATFTNLGITGSTANSYTITFTATFNSTNLTVAQSLISITYGDAAKVAVTTQAAGFVNRATFTTQPVVEVRDSADNKVANSTAAVTVSIDSGTLTGSTTVNAVGGVATFAGLGKTGLVGSKTLTFASTGLTSDTQTFTLTHGAATQVTLDAPSSLVNNTVFATQPVATIKDADGNTVTSGTQATQTVTLTSTDATISGTTSMAAVAGVADFSGKGVKLTGLVGSRNLTATITSPSTITGTASVTITFGAATKLALTTQAAGFVNRANFTTQPVVTIQDVSGNTVTSATDNVTVAITAGGGTITGTTTVAAINGIATFAGLGKTGLIGSKTMTFSSGSLTTDSQTFTLTHGAAAQVSITGSTTAQSGVALTTQPVATILDADGNTVTTGAQSTQTVTLTSADATIGGTTSMAAVAGVADFIGKGVTLTGTATNKSITATITSPATYTGTLFVSLSAGAATKLVLTTQAAGFVNRTDFTTQPVVEVRDAQDNVVTTSTAPVTVSISSGTITGTATVNAVAGIATFAGLGKTGLVGAKTLTFASTGLTSATQNFTLTHGATTQIGITNFVAPAGGPSYYPSGPQTSVAESTITSGGWTQCWSGIYNGSVSMSSVWASCTGGYLMYASGPTSSTTFDVVAAAPAADVKFDTGTSNTPHNANGSGWYYSSSYSMGFAKQGDPLSRNSCDTSSVNSALRLCWHTASGSMSGGYRSGATLGLNSATNYRRVIYMANASTVTSGVNFASQPVLALKDADGNICTSDTQSITASMTSGLTGTTTLAAVNGVVTFTDLKYTGVAGTQTISYALTANSSITTSEAISVVAGAATKLVLTTPAAGFVNRAAFTTPPVVTIQDVSGNTVTGSTAAVTVSIDSGTLTGTTTVNAVGGVATFTGLGKTGVIGTKTISFASNGLTGDSQTFTLTHGAATQVSLTAPASNANDAVLGTQPVATIRTPMATQ